MMFWKDGRDEICCCTAFTLDCLIPHIALVSIFYDCLALCIAAVSAIAVHV